eukprot:8226_1
MGKCISTPPNESKRTITTQSINALENEAVESKHSETEQKKQSINDLENETPQFKQQHSKTEASIPPQDKIKQTNPAVECIQPQFVVDMDVFQTNGTNCCGANNYDFNIKQCDHINRLIHGLMYYQSINPSDNNFTTFCVDIYKQLIDDHIHLVTKHSQQLEAIHQQLVEDKRFGECSINECARIQRHYTDNRRNKRVSDKKISKSTYDAKSAFYAETFDSIHHYLFHLFHLGMRTKNNEHKSQNNEHKSQNNEHKSQNNEHKSQNRSNNNNKYGYKDYEFIRKQQIISEHRKHIPFLMNRFGTHNTKFNIQVNNDADFISANNDTEKIFTDSLFERIERGLCSLDTIKKLYFFINDEEYDTDAFREDVEVDDLLLKSNIYNEIENADKLFGLIKTHINEDTLCSSSFSTGLIFYYWDWYKNTKQFDDDEIFNMNDHGGHAISSLYVNKKYNTFKQEILMHIDIEEYNDLVLLKAQIHVSTKRAKQIRSDAQESDYRTSDFHYDIPNDAPLSISNLISLILYCDFSNLSTEFSATFRRNELYEPLCSIKSRNREFWWLSKTLRETVQCFRDVQVARGDGPFYSGVSMVMAIPEFCIRLCSPTSTSYHIEVAMNFATRDGMIIQLNNTGHYYASFLSFFKCSWISKYKEESEVLWFGGEYRINIQSIRIIETAQNFEPLFRSLYLFDCMCNGTNVWLSGMEAKTHDAKVISSLLTETHDINAYVIQTFKLFSVQKHQIIINISNLNEYFGKMHHLIMHSVKDQLLDQWNSNDYDFSSHSNLMLSTVFKLFQNVQHVIVYTSHLNGETIYPFSLILFCQNIIHSLSWTKIEIKAACETVTKDSWINKIWSLPKCLSKIKLTYKANKFDIRLQNKSRKNVYGFWEESLIITREGLQMKQEESKEAKIAKKHKFKSTEKSIKSCYAVVYELSDRKWIVAGNGGWSEVHLCSDLLDKSFRILAWTVKEQQVLMNCNVANVCKYKQKSKTFYSFTDENNDYYGLKFYKSNSGIKQAKQFFQSVVSVIKNDTST